MTEDELVRIAGEGESQTLEFKASLSSGRQQEAIQSLVAFANRDGGRVLLGVRNNGSVVGVDIGQKTIEDLANLITARTYPSIAADIEVVRLSGKNVISVGTVADTPPLVGVYLYSPKSLEPTQPVLTSTLQAFRRVGATNQRLDFMVLRPATPSDVRLRIRLVGAHLYTDNDQAGFFNGRVWVEQGSASAHHVKFELSPWGTPANEDCPDLPFPQYKPSETTRQFIIEGTRYEGFTHAVDLSFEHIDLRSVPDLVEVRATYQDEHGLTWCARRRSRLTLERSSDGGGNPSLTIADTGEFDRRIVKFPAKSRLSGEVE